MNTISWSAATGRASFGRGARVLGAAWALLMLPHAASAGPHVDFDFARAVECRDVTPLESTHQALQLRLVELTLPVTARFRSVEPADVEELTIEISGAAAGLRVYDFAPATQLASDVAKEIETVTTTKSGRSLDATLGGALPVPFAAKVANVTPSISAGTSSGETMTEKLNRLPPKHAVVVSGTSLEGRGVFFKLKRSSQTSLEGIHVLAVTFIAPAGWRGGEVHVACGAQGQKKVLFMKQAGTLGGERGAVRLYLTSGTVRQVAKPIVAEAPPRVRQASFLETTAAQLRAAVVTDVAEKPAKPEAATAAKSSESEASPPSAESSAAAGQRE